MFVTDLWYLKRNDFLRYDMSWDLLKMLSWNFTTSCRDPCDFYPCVVSAGRKPKKAKTEEDEEEEDDEEEEPEDEADEDGGDDDDE